MVGGGLNSWVNFAADDDDDDDDNNNDGDGDGDNKILIINN